MCEEKELIKDFKQIGISISSISDLAKKNSTAKELIGDLKSIGVEVKSVRDLFNGFPKYEEVETILRKHYIRSKDIQFKAEIERALRRIEKGLIEDLKKVGINISSVWDLVNGPNDYKKAEPILIKHLKQTKECRFKEGIVRALGVPGFKNAIRPLIDEFKKSKDESFKWVIANSLSILKPKKFLHELNEIMADKNHGHARQMIADALGRIKDKSSVPVLLESLNDEDVCGHAVIALGKIGDPSTIKVIKAFTNHEKPWIRKEAKKAIERIEKKNK